MFNDHYGDKHSRHKSSFKDSKTIYVFTAGRVIVNVHIHGREMVLKELPWHLQNGHHYRSKAGFTLSCCKIDWKGLDKLMFSNLTMHSLCRCAVEMLLASTYWCGGSMAFNFVQIFPQVCGQCLLFHHHIAFTFWCFWGLDMTKTWVYNQFTNSMLYSR